MWLDERLFDEAERRLTRGEIGTALVLARNIRFHYWYDDWTEGRPIIRRACDIIARGYEPSDRPFAPKRIRKQAAEAIEGVA